MICYIWFTNGHTRRTTRDYKAGIVTSSYADDDERIKIITPEDVKAVLEK